MSGRMNNLYTLKISDGLKPEREQQDGVLQAMLDWNRTNSPEFCATMRLYLSSRRFLRQVEKIRMLMLPLVTGVVCQDMMPLVA